MKASRSTRSALSNLTPMATRTPRGHWRHVAIAIAIAAVGVGAGAAHADTLTWTGANNTTSNWVDNWSSDGAHTYPQAGDTAQLLVTGINNWTVLRINEGAAVGSLSARPNWGQYRIVSHLSGTRTFAFDNSGSESVVTVSHQQNSSSWTGLLQFGVSNNTMDVSLANDLRINNDGSRNSHGTVSFGSQTTLTGGTALDRRTITVESLGSSNIRASVGGAATFVGDWVVKGANATLDMNTDAFGDASNSVTLQGGVLDLDGLGAFEWNRTLAGAGAVKAAGGLTLGDDSLLDIALTGDLLSDLVSVTGAVALGGDLGLTTLGGYTPGAGDSWTILTATGGITGGFSTPLPVGYVASIVGNDLVLSYVPEPATLGLLGAGLLALAPRRRMTHPL